MSNSSNSLVPPQTLQDAFQDLEAGALSLSDYQELITSLEFQEMVEEWLTKIKSTTSTPCDITSRMLCVCPMIAYHLSDMVSDPTRKPHQKIYSQALHTIDVWDKFTGDNSITLEKLLQAFHNFSRHFRVWKKVDSFQVVEEYAKLYWELEVQKAAVVNFTESTEPISYNDFDDKIKSSLPEEAEPLTEQDTQSTTNTPAILDTSNNPVFNAGNEPANLGVREENGGCPPQVVDHESVVIEDSSL